MISKDFIYNFLILKIKNYSNKIEKYIQIHTKNSKNNIY